MKMFREIGFTYPTKVGGQTFAVQVMSLVNMFRVTLRRNAQNTD